MPQLVLGPLLRYVGEDCAVFWVETSGACEVQVLGGRARTFEVAGHHFGLVRAEGLEPGAWHEYEVALDGERVWPPAESEFPPSQFQTYPKEKPLRVVFGSCRVCAPHEEPFVLTKDADDRGREVDALYALAHRLKDQDREEWPDLLLMIGDQVYADEVSPHTRTFIDARRDVEEPPGERVDDFEEYTRLYRESWGEPVMRWLLSTVSTAMIFDDHDVHDDWNTSQAWVEEMRSQDWWHEHIVAALASYWVYQHLGNLAPEEQDRDPLLETVRELEGDAWEPLSEFAARADREVSGSKWSYCRDLGATRLVVIDSRAGRVLEEGSRSMVDEQEWDWIAEHATGGFDHLLIATSLPWLLSPGMNAVEAWNEAVCGGAWGGAAARAGETLRQTLDLEHWAAFYDSFLRMAELQRSVAAGERGPAPASIVTLSGDVHHAYLVEVGFPPGSELKSSVWQAVCSPFRNPLGQNERRVIETAWTRPFARMAIALARAAGVEDPPIRWRKVGGGPWFDNQFATLLIDGRRIEMLLEKTKRSDSDLDLEQVLQHRLA